MNILNETVTRPPLRYHGGKWRLAPALIEFFPEHKIYVEPFGGGASVLLRKQRSYAEIYNDLDGEVVNVFRVARDDGARLGEQIALTPYARAEFDLSYKSAASPLEQARRTIARAAMGFGGTLTRPNRDGSPQRTGFRCDSKRSGSVPAKDWSNFPFALQQITARLQGVVIENAPAAEVIARNDSPETLIYVDPPYVHSTRGPDAGGSHRGYRFEMTDAQHEDLAAQLAGVTGYVVLSGYSCDLYDRLYANWERFELHAHADGARDRTETVWLNEAAARSIKGRLLL